MPQAPEWGRFMRTHWRAFALFVVVCVAALVGSVYVFLWFVSRAESSGLVPTMLNLWTMANLVTFILNAVFWELVLIGIPLVVAAGAALIWWRSLPEYERSEYRIFEAPSRRSGGGGGGSLLLFIAFCIKVYLDGRWNVAIASWSLDYVVGSMVLILEWFVIIFGVPLVIVAIWWIQRGIKRAP
jgi:hypothetical protein